MKELRKKPCFIYKKFLAPSLALLLILAVFSGCSNADSDAGVLYIDESASNIYKSATSETTTETVESGEYEEVLEGGNIYYYKTESQTSGSSKTSSVNRSSSKKTSSAKASSITKSSKISSTSSVAKIPSVKRIAPSKTNIEKFYLSGRGEFVSGEGLCLVYGCSSIRFNLECQGDLIFSFSAPSGEVWIEIIIDGKTVNDRICIEHNPQCVTVADLNSGSHSVEIIRKTDCDSGELFLKSIEAPGCKLLAPPEYSDMYIEFIGDGNMLGKGVLLENSFFEDENFKTSTANLPQYQDCTLAYPALTAQKLGWDFSVIARQSTGIAVSYFEKSNSCLLPDLYQLQSLTSENQWSYSPKADVIVLDAGFTDTVSILLSHYGISSPQAVNIAIEFLHSLKQRNNDAPVIWCYGLSRSGTALENHISSVITMLGGEDEGYYTLKFNFTERVSGYASKEEHLRAANQLTAKIKEVIE